MPDTPTVLVTGAAGGVGRALTRRLVEDGWHVLAGVRSAEAAQDLAGPNTSLLEFDITDATAIEAACDAAERLLSGRLLTAVVNNAGVIVQGPLEALPLSELSRQLEVNVVGQVAVAQAFLPLLRRGEGDRVIFMGGGAARVALPIFGALSASKAALQGVVDALRMELRPQGIHVSMIEPGALATDIFEKADASATRAGWRGGPEVESLYRPATDAVVDAIRRQRAGDINSAVNAVMRALHARRPRARYAVGDARFIGLLQFLPARTRDAVLMRALRMPRAQAGGAVTSSGVDG